MCSSRALSLSRLRALFHVGAWWFGSRHSCLEFRFRAGFGHSSLCGSVLVSSSLDCAALLSRVFLLCCTQFMFYQLHAFMLYLVLCGTQLVYFIGSVLSCCHVCVNTWLMSFLISCVFRVLFCTWLVNCLLAICLCFCFV